MDRNELREQLVFKNYKWTASRYYDYPDGEDLLGKLSFALKAGFFAGGYFGLISAQKTLAKPTPKTALIHTFLWMMPFIGAPLTFTLVTYGSTRLRKKDDQLNYILGGLAAAFVAGTLARLPDYTAIFAIVFPTIGIMKKTAEMQGTKMFPPLKGKSYAPPYIQRAWNYSFVKDRKPDWTRENPNA